MATPETQNKDLQSATTSTKQYLAQQIAERERKNGSASLFPHSAQEKVEAMKLAQDELHVSSQALLNEQIKNLNIDPRSKKAGANDADLMLVDDRLKGLSKTDAEKLKESISNQLTNAQKGDRDYLQHIDDVLTDSS